MNWVLNSDILSSLKCKCNIAHKRHRKESGTTYFGRLHDQEFLMYTVQFAICIEDFVSILTHISVFRISIPICKHERLKSNCSSRLYHSRKF